VALLRELGKSREAEGWFTLGRVAHQGFVALVERGEEDTAAAAAALSTMYEALLVSTVLLFRNPRIEKRFLTVRALHLVLTQLVLLLNGQVAVIPGLRLAWPPRGIRPGQPQPHKRARTDEWIAAHELQAIAQLREFWGNDVVLKPAEIANWIPIPVTSYRRYLEQTRRNK
jgi:hypothetical protein